MAHMTQRKASLLFEGTMMDGTQGHAKLCRLPDGRLTIGTSSFRSGIMFLTAKQASAVRLWLGNTEP